MDRITDCCVNTVDQKVTTSTNLVIPEILWLICMVVSAHRLKYAVHWFLNVIR